MLKLTNIVSKIAKNTYFNSINRIAGFLNALLLSVVVARFLGPHKFGTYSLVAFTFIVADMVATLGLGITGTKYISEFSSGPGKEILRANIFLYIVKFKLVSTAIVVSALIITAPYFANFYSDKSLVLYIILSAINLIPSGFVAICVGAITGLQEYKYLAYRTLMLVPINFILYLLVLKLGYGIIGLITANIVISVIELIFYFSVIRKHFHLRVTLKPLLSLELKQRLLRYNWQVGLLLLADIIVWQRSQVFFLGKFHGASEIAFYSIAFGIVEKGITFIPSIFSSVLMPAMSELYGTENHKDLRTLYHYSFKYIFLFVLPIFCILFILSESVIGFLYGKEYLKAAIVLKILLISGFFRVIGSPSAGICYGIEKQDFLLKINSSLAFIIIFVNILLIPKFGAIGAATTHAFAQIVVILTLVNFVYKTYAAHYPLKDTLKIILATSVATTIGFIISKTQQNLWGLILATFCIVTIYILLVKYLKIMDDKDLKLFSQLSNKLPKPLFEFAAKILFTNKRWISNGETTN